MNPINPYRKLFAFAVETAEGFQHTAPMEEMARANPDVAAYLRDHFADAVAAMEKAGVGSRVSAMTRTPSFWLPNWVFGLRSRKVPLAMTSTVDEVGISLQKPPRKQRRLGGDDRTVTITYPAKVTNSATPQVTLKATQSLPHRTLTGTPGKVTLSYPREQPPESVPEHRRAVAHFTGTWRNGLDAQNIVETGAHPVTLSQIEAKGGWPVGVSHMTGFGSDGDNLGVQDKGKYHVVPRDPEARSGADGVLLTGALEKFVTGEPTT